MMRLPHFALGSLLAMAAMTVKSSAHIVDVSPILPIGPSFAPSKRTWRRGGKAYPHSSDRQKARYARQIAAGQIHFIQHGQKV